MSRLIAWRRLFSWTVGLVLIGSAGVVAAEDHAGRNNQGRIDASVAAQEIALSLQSVINNRLGLTGGLAAYARSHIDTLSQADFAQFASDISVSFERYRGAEWTDQSIRSLQLAPDGIVTFVWPLETNQAALGHDIINDPARGATVRRSIEDGDFILAGPFELVQGGSGLVGRSPIFTESEGGESFWGFATIVLDFDAVLALAGVSASPNNGELGAGYNVAVRGHDGLGADGEVFVGDAEVFSTDPVTASIQLPQGTWELAVAPNEGWTPFGARRATKLVFAVGLLLALVVGYLCRRWLNAQWLAQETSDDLAALLESIDGPVIASDAKRRVTHWNLAATKLTGRSAVDVLGRSLSEATADFRPRRGGSTLVDVGERTLADSSPRTAETTLEHVDAAVGPSSRDFDFAVGPRSGGGLVLVGVDTTTRHEHDRMAVDIAALKQTSLMKDQFVSTTSHEMRTPLTSIIGLTELLADGSLGDLNEAQQKAIGTIDRSGAHMLSVVDQILDLAQTRAKGLQVSFDTIDCRLVAQSIVGIAEPIAAAKSIDLQQSIIGSPIWVEADRLRLGEVILNLLSNAIKFTDSGGTAGIEVSTSDEEVEIVVWDTGVGIPVDQQHLLFQPFVRIESTTFSNGTGLGLTIADEIVNQHGGTISVDSLPGVLTSFTVKLPLAAALVPSASALVPS